MENTSIAKDIHKVKLSLDKNDSITSSRLRKYDQLLESKAPKREFTQKYQSQPSISHSNDAKSLSQRSLNKSLSRQN